MSDAITFPIIDGAHWARAIARGQREANQVRLQIQAAIALIDPDSLPEEPEEVDADGNELPTPR